MSGGRVILPRQVSWLTTAATPRDQWLQVRRQGIGGSDAAAILGRSGLRTAADVWLEKTGRTGGQTGTRRMRWGQLLEDVIAREWAARDECTIRRCGTVADPLHPWRLASLDRVVLVPRTLRAASLLEVKTTSERWATEVGDEGLADAFNPQVQWYLGITGLEDAYLAVLVGGQELRELAIRFDIDMWHRLCDAADAFWHDHVLADVCPPVDYADSSGLNAWPASNGTERVADPELLELLALRQMVRAEAKELTADADLLDAAVKARMGEATELVDGSGRVVATWREQASTRVDVAALKDAGLYQEYSVSGTTRVLRVKKERL